MHVHGLRGPYLMSPHVVSTCTGILKSGPAMQAGSQDLPPGGNAPSSQQAGIPCTWPALRHRRRAGVPCLPASICRASQPAVPLPETEQELISALKRDGVPAPPCRGAGMGPTVDGATGRCLQSGARSRAALAGAAGTSPCGTIVSERSHGASRAILLAPERKGFDPVPGS